MIKKRAYPYTLSELEVFSDCRRGEFELLGSLLTPVTVEAGDVIMCQGSHSSEAFIIDNGCALVTADDGAAERALGVVSDGEPLGEMSLLYGVPRTATVTALTRTALYVATSREFASLLNCSPSFAAKVAATAARRHESNKAA